MIYFDPSVHSGSPFCQAQSLELLTNLPNYRQSCDSQDYDINVYNSQLSSFTTAIKEDQINLLVQSFSTFLAFLPIMSNLLSYPPSKVL